VPCNAYDSLTSPSFVHISLSPLSLQALSRSTKPHPPPPPSAHHPSRISLPLTTNLSPPHPPIPLLLTPRSRIRRPSLPIIMIRRPARIAIVITSYPPQNKSISSTEPKSKPISPAARVMGRLWESSTKSIAGNPGYKKKERSLGSTYHTIGIRIVISITIAIAISTSTRTARGAVVARAVVVPLGVGA